MTIRLRVFRIALFIAVIAASPGSAQLAQRDTGLARQLGAEVIRLLPAYPERARDQLVAPFIERLNARGQRDSALALLGDVHASLAMYRPFIEKQVAVPDVDGALTLMAAAPGTAAEHEALRRDLLAQAANDEDTASVTRILATFAADSTRFNALLFGVEVLHRSPNARQILLRQALSLVRDPAHPDHARWIERLAIPLAGIGDLSAVRALDALGDPYDRSKRLVDIAAILRCADDVRADSVYSVALQLIEGDVNAGMRGLALYYYWTRYMPALSDTNPLRFLEQADTGAARYSFLRGVMAIHLGKGRTAIPLRVATQLAERGDTAMAVRILFDPYNFPIDYFGWQPRGDPAVRWQLVDRALELTASRRDTALRAYVREIAIEEFRQRDPARAAALRSEITGGAQVTASDPYDIFQLALRAPDSALVKTSLVADSARRDWLLAVIANVQADQGHADAARGTTERISSVPDRILSRLSVASRDSIGTDSVRVRRIIEDAMRSLDSLADHGALSLLMPLMLRYGMGTDAVQWAESQPDTRRAYALVPLLQAIWARDTIH